MNNRFICGRRVEGGEESCIQQYCDPRRKRKDGRCSKSLVESNTTKNT